MNNDESTNRAVSPTGQQSSDSNTSGERSTRPAAPPPATAGPGTTHHNMATRTGTVTVTETEEEAEVLELNLRPRPQVRWDENVVDNEGMGRKSSKRCCIFHKQRDFGESSTDSSDYDSDTSGSESSTASGADGKPDSQQKRRKGRIARPKKDKKVPDYQRFHA